MYSGIIICVMVWIYFYWGMVYLYGGRYFVCIYYYVIGRCFSFGLVSGGIDYWLSY